MDPLHVQPETRARISRVGASLRRSAISIFGLGPKRSGMDTCAMDTRLKRLPLPVLAVLVFVLGFALGELLFAQAPRPDASPQTFTQALPPALTDAPSAERTIPRAAPRADVAATSDSAEPHLDEHPDEHLDIPGASTEERSSDGSGSSSAPDQLEPVGSDAVASGSALDQPQVVEDVRLGDLPGTTTTRLARDPLSCACGDAACESLDRPSVSHVLSGFKSMARVEAAFRSIREMQGVREVVLAAGQLDPMELRQLAAAVFGPGYRDEPLELVSLVYTNEDTPKDELVSAMARMSAGAQISIQVEKQDATEADEFVLEASHSRDQVLASVEHPTSMDPSYSGRKASFVVQYFKRQNLVKQIARALSLYAIDKEVLVHDDSASEHDEWIEALNSTRYFLVHSGNLHEIRGYNRLARMASSDTVVLLQDDDVPPAEATWIEQAWGLFEQFPKLGLIGGLNGQIQGGPDTGRYGKQRARHVRQIPLKDNMGLPFMFVTWVNMGPFILRRSVFLKVGSFQESFACRGDPGIGFDYEYGIRLWQKGYHVGLTIQGFRYHVGATRSGGTRSSSSIKQRRDMLESRNTAFIHAIYKGFYVNHAPNGANRSPGAVRMSLANVCTAARLPTIENNKLRASKHDTREQLSISL